MLIEKAIAIADAYEVARIKQNAGEACTHCECNCGHYGFCPLINRNTAEARSAQLSAADVVRAHALGITY